MIVFELKAPSVWNKIIQVVQLIGWNEGADGVIA
jgi:hypothetical protein